MRLHEYQAKRIFEQFGVPVPRGRVAASVAEVRQIADWLGERIVLKAQVVTGGRGRAGGIRLANDAAEAERLASRMFGMDIHGYVASKLLVDQAIEVEREIYVGVTIDRGTVQPVIVASATGGIEISEVARDTPERVCQVPIDPTLGLRAYQVRELAYDIGLSRRETQQFVSIALGLSRVFAECEATLVEANPLVVCPDGAMISLNARIVLDDHALFRHPELGELRDESQETPTERLARRHCINYVRLGGHVGCVSNGAGLAMATMDLLRMRGIRAANFVDIGMGAQVEKVLAGLHLALDNSTQVVLVNIFGGVTRCDEIARGILAACDELTLNVPLVVRLEGTNKEAGYALMAKAGETHEEVQIHMAESLGDAVEQVALLLGMGERV